MIKDFADQTSQDIFDGAHSKAARKIPHQLWAIAQRKLDMIGAAHEIRDLSSPPGNRLEGLKGDLKGFYSVRINDQYRIVFQFINGSASKVKIIDYH